MTFRSPFMTSWLMSFAIGCLTVSGDSHANDAGLMGGTLDYGPFDVGFRAEEIYDHSRTFGARFDYYGAEIATETSRRLQICTWYPAVSSDESSSMVYAEYAYPFPKDPDFGTWLAGLQNREIGALHQFLQNNEGWVQDAMNFVQMAVRDAPPAGGPFPLIAYHPAVRGTYCQNAILCEYLASHGFIVVTTHPIGASRFVPAETTPDLETVLRDLEMAVARMHENPQADAKNLGILGFSSGSLTALLLQTRNAEVDAVVTLHARLDQPGPAALLTSNPNFDPSRMTVPYLRARPVPGENGPDYLDSLRYAQRYSLDLSGLGEFDFTVYQTIAALAANVPANVRDSVRSAHARICRHTMAFFKTHLKHQPSDWEDLVASDGTTPDLVLSHRSAEDRPPTVPQYMGVLRRYGVDSAVALADRFGLIDPDHPLLPDQTINAIGYGYLQSGALQNAVAIFRMGTVAYPASANAWDSYAEALLASGDSAAALSSYSHSLAILPADTLLDPRIIDAIRQNTPARIEQLEQLLSGHNTASPDGSE